MTTIYVDELLLVNTILNYILLYVTKKISRGKASIYRILLGSVVGAIYAIFMYIPDIGLLYGFIGKVLFSILLVGITYKIYSFRDFVKTLGTLYLVSFAFGGGVYALLSMCGFYNMVLPVKILAISTVISYLLIHFISSYHQRRTIKELQLNNLKITMNNHVTTVNCLLDTGNSLYEPITNKPVVVVEFNSIQDVLPIDMLTAIALDKFNSKFRLIPYKSLGMNSGFIWGFKPDKAEIGDKTIDCIIGVYKSKLSSDNCYNALLNPEVMA